MNRQVIMRVLVKAVKFFPGGTYRVNVYRGV